jgi:hypothetical protein
MRFVLRLALLAVLIAAILYWRKSNGSPEPLISINDQSGSFSITVREKDKEELKKYLREIKALIYREATVHNPEGDVLPDQVDDKVIEEVKERVN